MIALDFFKAPAREEVENLIAEIESRHKDAEQRLVEQNEEPAKADLGGITGRTWVTRKGIYVDRIASAWFIRRFIDPDGGFKFVDQ